MNISQLSGRCSNGKRLGSPKYGDIGIILREGLYLEPDQNPLRLWHFRFFSALHPAIAMGLLHVMHSKYMGCYLAMSTVCNLVEVLRSQLRIRTVQHGSSMELEEARRILHEALVPTSRKKGWGSHQLRGPGTGPGIETAPGAPQQVGGGYAGRPTDDDHGQVRHQEKSALIKVKARFK